jgi:Holliday junction resolvase RusA-like endonuclease
MRIILTIPGKPIPKARPRFSKWGTYDVQSKLKKQVAMQIKEQIAQQGLLKPVVGEITCHMTFYMPIPKSWPKNRLKQLEGGNVPHVKRPDCSNMCKFYEDILNGLAYEDDSQITKLTCEKVYSLEPRTYICIDTES